MSARPYRALAVANAIIHRAQEARCRDLDPMKLQKLLYFAHGWHLAITGKPLMDEHLEAWEYGPVVPSVYRSFRRYGAEPISDMGTEYRDGYLASPGIPNDDTEVHDLLNKVWAVYSPLSGLELSRLSHTPGSPWDTTVKAAKSFYGYLPKGEDISDELVRSYFQKLAANGARN